MSYIFDQPPSKYIDSINENNFDDIALSLFRYQYQNNGLYHDFVNALNIDLNEVLSIEKIPFLPVSFYKTHKVLCGIGDYDLTFRSSSTTSDTPGVHYVKDKELYEQSLLSGFEHAIGRTKDFVFLALLPSYLERKDASLVYMVQYLMSDSDKPENGFYLNEFDQLSKKLLSLKSQGKQVILFGVTFALLQFAEEYPNEYSNLIIIETGGMKGKGKELTRQELHSFLNNKLKPLKILSEYGMTEMLSQAYLLPDGYFKPSSSIKVLARSVYDPFEVKLTGSGCINVIDLANIHSCSFIATDDICTIRQNGEFEVLGRVDNSALRGCNLMVL